MPDSLWDGRGAAWVVGGAVVGGVVDGGAVTGTVVVARSLYSTAATGTVVTGAWVEAGVVTVVTGCVVGGVDGAVGATVGKVGIETTWGAPIATSCASADVFANKAGNATIAAARHTMARIR